MYHVWRYVIGKYTIQFGIITTFWSNGDPQNPNPELACKAGILRDSDYSVASKTFPCGTKILFWNPKNGHTATGVVDDYGPKHAMADVTKQIAKELNSHDFAPVFIFVRK